VTEVRSARVAAALTALVMLALFLLLGYHVTHRSEPAALIPIETALLNHGSLIAWWLTWMGYAYVLGPLCIALIAMAWRFPQWRARVAFGIVVLLLCWIGADFFQHFFQRPRRLDWVVKHETAFSYPSSHAAIAVGFYLLWGEIVRRSELAQRVRLPVALLLDVVAVAILWARLALGAHYLTDLLGGALWALAVIAAGIAVFPTKVLSPTQGRP
jgi:membrane-associated phospholipid phosphatase